MSDRKAESLEKLISYFSSLPSIGRKTAARLVYHILRQPSDFAIEFGESLKHLHQNVHLCSECFNFTENDPCKICSDPRRSSDSILVVEQPSDVPIVEKTKEFKGKYHVLHGILNPLDGIGPSDIKLRELMGRLTEIKEVIIAINPTVEGEVTAQYIAKMVKPLDIIVRKIASGIPMGHQLEFSDEATIARAINGAIEI